ncbi:MAG: BolA/IbaG family iron-sulfur metabolism protein [Neisseriaceae bacterium]|nr:MAG: BolA/IbaG family iron-sulfur metabolism protein [Neisseriaceae bacterium]
MLEDVIYQAINANIPCVFLDVTGDGRHFEAVVVSENFVGQQLIKRHRMIYAALGERMKEEIHALSMKLYTSEEWKKLNG